MATFTAIPEKTQTATAMKRVIDYVLQDKKTVYNGIKLVGGQNCVPDTAYQEFMATKYQYNKANGVFFKQYVQSFKPDIDLTPSQVHQIGLEMAKAFDGYEVVVATHIDRDHWHNHFVVNSVSCETGLKIQINEKGLEQLRHRSDEICRQFGLEVLTPYQKPKQKSLNQREYRAAIRGNSKKLKLTNAIDYAVATSRSKAQFIDRMKKFGYGVKWIDHYKFITYTTPDGQRFRDNRLLEDKYLKTNMEELFAYEYGWVKTDKPNTAVDRADGEGFNRADTTNLSATETGTIQFNSQDDIDNWASHCAKYGFDIRIADTSGFAELDTANAKTVFSGDAKCNGRQAELDRIFSQGKIIEANGNFGENPRQENIADDVGDESQRPNTLETEGQVGGGWLDITANGLYLAADIAMIGGGSNDEKPNKKKTVRERKNGQKKKQTNDSHDDGGITMNM